MTDNNTLAPTDAEILDAATDFRSQHMHGGTTFEAFDEIGFARAVLAKWGAPASASSEPVAAPACVEPVARIRYERNTPGRENEMPRVLSCNRMADGVYEVFTASQVQAALAAAPSGPVRVPLTAAQMAAGREAIFSTANPYCPCDSKTFRKVAEWVERHHGITAAPKGGQPLLATAAAQCKP